MTTFGKIDDVDTLTTMDAKAEGHLIYVVGSSTKEDLGGSEYVNMHSEREGIEFNIGVVSTEKSSDVYDTFTRMNQAQRERLVQSANYVGNGGLVTAIKETALAGRLGSKLTSTRYITTIRPACVG